MAAAQHRLRRGLDIWPGFVDALATLLIIIIFTLMIFVVAQFYLTDALSGRDRALERLQREIVRLGEMLSLERDESDSLRRSLNEISAELQATLSSRDRLSEEVRGLELSLGDMEQEAQRLRDEVLRLADDAEALRELRDRLLKETEGLRGERDALVERTTTLEQEQARLSEEAAALLRERDRLAAAADALKRERDKISEQAAALERERDTLAGTADTLQRERDQLSGTAESLRTERDALARAAEVLRRERKELSETVASLETDRDSVRRRADASAAEVTRKSSELEKARRSLELLNRQVAALREQLASLQEVLDAQEAKNKDQQVKIEDLTQRLNVALAVKVKKLEQYRSEFFGRLREVLGSRADIQIVGDRFVFQSEVLFETASANLGDEGKKQMATLAATLTDISTKIPQDIDWILRVDGHTDKRPIFNLQFRSNWELSAGRAISVVNFLISQGIPPNRLAATGFGQFQPIDPGENEEALRKNRRIELKFDQR